MKIRIVCKHDHDTAALDKLGRKNGMGSTWLVARCALSVDCPALAYVKAKPIEAAIGNLEADR